MKTLVSLFLSTLLTVFLFQNVHSQSTTAGPGALGHTGAAVGTDWCGWNAGVPIPFNLEHRGTLDMNFLTGGIQRMTVKGTAAGATIGFVGIGLTAPVSLLHVNSTATGELFRTQGPAASVNSWRMSSSLIFRTGGGSGTGSQRMRIQNLSGWMLIGTNASAPSSLLHVDGVTSMSTPVGEVFRTDGPAAQEF
ncbi:MAG: hypothetical protein K0S44_890 [Bacteroidetes bacterium]|nr:hypothetical protein [Bacteroidota bacterium]